MSQETEQREKGKYKEQQRSFIYKILPIPFRGKPRSRVIVLISTLLAGVSGSLSVYLYYHPVFAGIFGATWIRRFMVSYVYGIFFMYLVLIVGRLIERFQLKLSREELDYKPSGPSGESESQYVSALDKNRLNSTVVEILHKERQNNTIIIASLLVVTLIIYFLVCYGSSNQISIGALSIPLFFLLARLTNQYILTYRIRHGYYGTTEYESREIINLILKHSNKSDFTDGNGLKELFPEAESDERRIGDFVPSPRGTAS